MDTLQNDTDGKKDLDDSGCVQDVGPPVKQTEMEYERAGLMDLSDDVLLYILRYCCPRDLKALGFTCSRLGRLVLDRSLWVRVDARDHPVGIAKLRWFLTHALSAHTTELLLEGFAKEARRSGGNVDGESKKADSEGHEEPQAAASDPGEPGPSKDSQVQIIQADPMARTQQVYTAGLTRPAGNLHTPNSFGSPSWPDGVSNPDTCAGPVFTVTKCSLLQLRVRCRLVALALENCNIDCNKTNISHFPPALKKLSLKGSKCYNLPLDKSFLFNIQDYLSELEELDLSECEWLEPAALLPLSKAPVLKKLSLRHCRRLGEFVAYASLASRYGFRSLEVLDMRGSPVADSEASAFGWLPSLRELYLSPEKVESVDCGVRPEMEPWEIEEPEYFKAKARCEGASNTDRGDLCYHDVDYNSCTEGIRPNQTNTENKTTKIPSQDTKHKLPADGPSPKRIRLEEPRLETPSGCPEINLNLPDRVLKTLRKRFGSPIDSTPSKRKHDSTEDAKTDQEESSETNPNVDSVEEKASTSKEESAEQNGNVTCKNPEEHEAECKCKEKTVSEFVRFRQNMDPVIVRREMGSSADDSNENNRSEEGASTSEKVKKEEKNGNVYSLCNKSLIERWQSGSSSAGNPDKKNTSEEGASTSKKVKEDEAEKNGNVDNVGNNPLIERWQFGNSSADDPKENNHSEEASTSKKEEEQKNGNAESFCESPGEHASICRCKERKVYEYIRFRQNKDPIIVRKTPEEVERDRQREEESGENREARPRAHVLYVNIGQQNHSVYRLSIHNEPPIFYSYGRNNHVRYRPNAANTFNTPTPHLDPSSLITDAAVRRFGRADVEDVAYIHIGRRQGPGEPGGRPDRSTLRVLSMTGYRNITDRSLVHLATAAPELRRVDFSGTGVTRDGVENFKSMRPDCEVVFTEGESEK